MKKSIADDDIRIAKICENAKKYRIGVVLTAFTKGNNKQPQNSAFAGIEMETVLITQFCWLTIRLREFYMQSLIWKLLENIGIEKC